MDSRKFILGETLFLAIAMAVCVAAMIGVFALLGYFDQTVVVGGIAGGILAIANFFVMAVMADMAADKAQQQDVKGGQSLIQASMLGRYVVLFVLLAAGVKSGFCNAFAMVLPLVFVRPIVTMHAYFKKEG